MSKTFIIAEAGVNHNGSVKLAKRMIDVAKDAGADAVKFQSFKAEAIASTRTPKASYQNRNSSKEESHLQMLKRLELNEKAHKELFHYCQKRKIMFLSSPFDKESIELLYRIGVKTFKIPSGEITNLPYLRKIGSLKKQIIMSTGMADLKEIKKALDILTQGGTPKSRITLLHCNTAYPTPFKDVNLLAMLTLREVFKVKVGYSDHTLGIEIAVGAVALGAAVIEKHFTLNKNMDGPDHRASLAPEELKNMVKAIRNIEIALGSGIKKPSPLELKNRYIVRKSIVAARDIDKDEVFTEENITVKRPGRGISPMFWDTIIGKRAKRKFKKEEFIKL